LRIECVAKSCEKFFGLMSVYWMAKPYTAFYG
jgi:hypothetical protein